MGSNHNKYSDMGILLCHGYLSCKKQMEPLENHLKKLGFKTYSVCLYGHGTDPTDLNKVSWEFWLKNVEDGYYSIRKSCKKLFVIGFSMGGCLSLILSSMKEKRIDGLVVINPCMGIRDKLNFMVPYAVKWNNFVSKLGWKKLAIKYVNSETELPSINYKRNSLHGTNELMKLMTQCWGILDKVWNPCLVIQEKSDPTVLYKSGELAFEQIVSTNKKFVSTELGVHATMYLECCRDTIFGMVDKFINDTLENSFLSIGHRGASGHVTENTLSSFEKAIELGCDMIEFDVRKVGMELVVFHDSDLTRMFGINKLTDDCHEHFIRNLKLENGETVPTLDQVINFIDRRTKINIELKGAHTGTLVAAKIVELVKTSEWEYSDFLVSSFSKEELSLVKDVSKDIRLGLLFDERGRDLIDAAISLTTASFLNAWSVNVSGEVVSEELVNIAHNEGMKVLVYTINDPEEIRTLKALGVDGIFSDYPERV